MIDRSVNKSWRALAKEIVRNAVKDWQQAQKILDKDPDNERAFDTAEECEEFFRSDWYKVLQGLNPYELPENLILKLKERIK